MNNVVAQELIGSLIGLIEDGQGSDYDGAFNYAIDCMKKDTDKIYQDGVEEGFRDGVEETLRSVSDDCEFKSIYNIIKKSVESSCRDCVSRLSLIKHSRTLFVDGKQSDFISLDDVLSAQSVRPEVYEAVWIKRSDDLWQCLNCGEYHCCAGKYCSDCGFKMENAIC